MDHPPCRSPGCDQPRRVWPSGRVATYCATHQLDYQHRYREVHREVFAAASLRYRESHPSLAREMSRRWRQEHPEYVRDWHHAHGDDERISRRERREANLEEVRMKDAEAARASRAAHPGRHAGTVRRWQYGLPAGAIEAMYAAQDGRCAICDVEKPMTGRGGLHVDHDHASGAVRGLLCAGCNAALVSLERIGPSWSTRAFSYLASPPYPTSPDAPAS